MAWQCTRPISDDHRSSDRIRHQRGYAGEGVRYGGSARGHGRITGCDGGFQLVRRARLGDENTVSGSAATIANQCDVPTWNPAYAIMRHLYEKRSSGGA